MTKLTTQQRADGIAALYIEAIRTSTTPLPDLLERLAKLLGSTTARFDDVVAERDKLRARYAALVARLPRCSDCNDRTLATRHLDDLYFCDAHDCYETSLPLPWASLVLEGDD